MKLLVAILLLSYTSFSQDSIPELNGKIISFVKKNIGKKVGRGECWDLVQIPLNENKANWDGEYGFGGKVNYKKDQIFPGDIIQFEKVEIKIKDGNKTYTYSYYHHTAVVYEVLSKGKYKIAEQNTDKGKKVTIDELDLNFMTKGKVQFFRPEN